MRIETPLNRVIADALKDSAGLSQIMANKAANATLQALTSQERVAGVDPYVLLISARPAKLSSRNFIDRLDHPTFVSSLNHLVSTATAVPEQSIDAAANILSWAAEPLMAATAVRVVRALTVIMQGASQEVLTKAAAAPSDLDALLTALEGTEDRVADSDAEMASARARGIEMRRSLLATEVLGMQIWLPAT